MFPTFGKSGKVLTTISSVILASCASSSGEIASAYVSPAQYAAFNCDQLQLELVRLNRKKTDLALSIDEKASSDEGMVAISAILFWPAAFAVGGNQALEAEYARLKGEFDAVQQAGIEKGCNLDSNDTGVSVLVKNYPTDKSVYNYYGDAEDELNAGDVDRNLWARALVEVEGDEAKRKAKYIELRAEQLHMANEGKATSASLGEEKISPTDPNQQAVKYNLTGVYRSKIIYNQRIKKGKVRIEQSGTEVTGKSLQSRWEFEGELEGDNIKFKWYSTANKGRGKFTVDPGGKIIGEFHGDSWGEGDWILVKEL